MRLYIGLLLTLGSAFSQDIVPYSLIEISRQFDAAGNLKSESRFLFAVNSEGALVSVDLDPSAGGARQILDFRRGQTMVVDPKSKTVSRFSYHPQRSGEPCQNRFFSFRDARVSFENSAGTMEGVAVQRVSVDWRNGRAMDVFMAPSLGCQVLRSLSRNNGFTLETRAAKELRIGDPDPDLFQIPTDYRETK
jgi:hypothetical protein